MEERTRLAPWSASLKLFQKVSNCFAAENETMSVDRTTLYRPRNGDGIVTIKPRNLMSVVSANGQVHDSGVTLAFLTVGPFVEVGACVTGGRTSPLLDKQLQRFKTALGTLQRKIDEWASIDTGSAALVYSREQVQPWVTKVVAVQPRMLFSFSRRGVDNTLGIA